MWGWCVGVVCVVAGGKCVGGVLGKAGTGKAGGGEVRVVGREG